MSLPEAKKSLGQNFLVDDNLCRKIVDAAQIGPHDTVIEIGPGAGALTGHLAARAQRVLAVELDPRMLPLLPQLPNLKVLHADALEVNFGEHLAPGERVRFVGNLPYYITSALLRKMLESGLAWQGIVCTVQMEVAQRIVAKPGDLSLLAVSVQFYGKPELLFRIPPSAFKPQPDVESAVIRITPHAAQNSVAPETFFRVARAGFSQPRKQLRNPLAEGLGIAKSEVEALCAAAGVAHTRRAETLSIDEWATMARAFSASSRE